MSLEQFPLIDMAQMSYAYSKPQISAGFKQAYEDFQVIEHLSFEPEGSGTHAYLFIQKENTNTLWLAKQLARFAQIPVKDVGYAGLKDRQGKTSQWFSINLEGINEPDWQSFELDGVSIKKITYHRRKLKVGAIAFNEFKITLKDLSPINQELKNSLLNRLEQIKQHGVPNYFGPQRFGHAQGNLAKAAKWFAGELKLKNRQDKSLILSAARSMLFNELLSKRIENKAWNTLLEGEVFMLDGSHAIFNSETIDEDIIKRFEIADIHPTAALWGRGRLSSMGELLALEQKLESQYPSWCQALENKGLKQERRAIRLMPKNLSYTFNGADLNLSFELTTGSYATSVLRELINTQE